MYLLAEFLIAVLVFQLLLQGCKKFLWPAILYFLYATNTAVNRLVVPDHAKAAGTSDFHYFACALDLSDGPKTLRMENPEAVYFQVGLYDAHTNYIPGAHVNNLSLPLGEELTFVLSPSTKESTDPYALTTGGLTKLFLLIRILGAKRAIGNPTIESMPRLGGIRS